MLILGLLGMYFDAAVVFVTSQILLLRLAVAILCLSVKKPSWNPKIHLLEPLSYFTWWILDQKKIKRFH